MPGMRTCRLRLPAASWLPGARSSTAAWRPAAAPCRRCVSFLAHLWNCPDDNFVGTGEPSAAAAACTLCTSCLPPWLLPTRLTSTSRPPSALTDPGQPLRALRRCRLRGQLRGLLPGRHCHEEAVAGGAARRGPARRPPQPGGQPCGPGLLAKGESNQGPPFPASWHGQQVSVGAVAERAAVGASWVRQRGVAGCLPTSLGREADAPPAQPCHSFVCILMLSRATWMSLRTAWVGGEVVTWLWVALLGLATGRVGQGTGARRPAAPGGAGAAGACSAGRGRVQLRGGARAPLASCARFCGFQCKSSGCKPNKPRPRLPCLKPAVLDPEKMQGHIDENTIGGALQAAPWPRPSAPRACRRAAAWSARPAAPRASLGAPPWGTWHAVTAAPFRGLVHAPPPPPRCQAWCA